MTTQKYTTYIAIFFSLILSLSSFAQTENSLKHSPRQDLGIVGNHLHMLGNTGNQTNSTNSNTQFSSGCDDYTLLQVRICDGDSLFASDAYQHTTGVYFDTLTNVANCDSIVETNLYVVPPIFITENASICQGGSYSFGVNVLTTGGVYNATLVSSDGCDSTVQLNLTVLPTSSRNLSQNICQGDVYFFGGNNLTTSGIYRDTLVSFNGCDSIEILNLTVFPTSLVLLDTTICQGSNIVFAGNTLTASGTYYHYLMSSEGCDSIIQMDLTVLPSSNTVVAVTMCQGDTYTFAGNSLTTMGLYTNTLVSSNGCDSTIQLFLTVVPSTTTNLAQNICQGDVYFFGGNNLTTSGIYNDTLVAINGCDSILSLNLTVFPTSLILLDTTICQGSNIVFAGNTLTASGSYYHYLMSSEGCDSIIQMDLTVLPSSNTVVAVTMCQGDTYTFAGNSLTTMGLYTNTLVSSNGCDSTIQLFLTVVPSTTTNLAQNICQGDVYFFGGNNLTTSGIYNDTLVAINGCDSILSLNLTVFPTSLILLDTTICQGSNIVFAGNTLTASGSYYHYLMSSEGCDSIIQMDLTVLPSSNTVVAVTMCQGDTYTFAGNSLTTMGLYTNTLVSSNGCDSTIQLFLTVVPSTTTNLAQNICQGDVYFFGGNNLTTSGIYNDTLVAINGCDSILSLNLTVFPTSLVLLDTTICQGSNIVFAGNTLTASGIYYNYLMSSEGCDSIIQMDLTVLPSSNTVVAVTMCQGDTYTFAGNSLTTMGLYTNTLVSSNGCDSTIQLYLTVLPATPTNLAQNICQGDVYSFGGNNLTASGTYNDTLVSSNGCDSIIQLDLTVLPILGTTLLEIICEGDSYSFGGNNLTTMGFYTTTLVSSNGCDSVVQLHLTVLPRIITTLSAAICQGETYSFAGNNLTTSGVYSDTLVWNNGCDSIVLLDLTVLPNVTTTLSQTICQGETYLFAGNNLTASGTHNDTLVSNNGCDSIIQLDLTVLPSLGTTLLEMICEGDSYPFGGNNLTTMGFYTTTLVSSNGCDSVVQLHLTVLPRIITTLSATICQGETYSFAGNNLTTSGVYSDTLVWNNGCDSIVQLDLTVLPSLTTTLSETLCQGDTYFFGGNNLATSGLYNDTLVSSNGCDSTVQLNLTILPSSTTTLLEIMCQGDTYSFGGNDLTTMGFYTTTLVSSNGCDSTVQLHLTVLPSSTTTLSATICKGDTYTFGGINLTTSGIYNDLLVSSNGCDSIIQLNLTVLPSLATTLSKYICEGDSIFLAGAYQSISGTYQDILTNTQGCDSVVITQLIVNPINQIFQTISICENDSILLGNAYQNTAGIYQDTLFSQGSCYSILTTTLLIESTVTLNVDTTICQGDSILLGNAYRHTSGVYQDILTSANGCPLVVNTNLTVNVIGNIDMFPNVLDTICVESDAFSLNSLVSYQNLEIVNNLFDPTLAHQGAYTFVGTYQDDAGCSYTESKIVYVMDCVTPISTISTTLPYLTVYPSPSSGQFYIDLGVVNSDYYRLTTVDELGRVVYEEEFENISKNSVVKQHSMDLSRFSEGIYYTRLMTDSKVLVQKIQIIR